MDKRIPPAPPGWNKTIEDLMAECDRGERPSVGSPEVDWARDYERSLIPSHMRFPKPGDVYEALTDVKIRYLTSWAAPFTGGGNGLLRAGEQVIVDKWVTEPKPVVVYATAVDYAGVEQRMIPTGDRNDAKYRGYYFALKTVDLNMKFKLLQENG